MSGNLGSKAAIVGIGRVINRPAEEDLKSPLQLGAMAAIAALRDAGIGRGQVGAFFTGRCPTSYRTLQYNQTLLTIKKKRREM